MLAVTISKQEANGPWELTLSLITLKKKAVSTCTLSCMTNTYHKAKANQFLFYLCHRVKNVVSFAMITFVFLLMADWDKCTKWPKLTLNTRSKVPPPHTHVIRLPTTAKFKSFWLQCELFSVMTFVFLFTVILRQVHRMTPKWHWTLKG